MRDRQRLEHMLEAAQKAVSLTQAKSRQDLDDDVLCLALVKLTEIVGEAAGRVSEEQKTALPEVPWDLIVAMRNRLVHAYFNVNLDALWRTIAEDLPILVAQLEWAISQGETERRRVE